MRIRRKRCLFCGRYYRPDRRAGDNQKSCGRGDCPHKRKAKAQWRWVEANPEYFSGRYANTQAWRQEHPDYQRQWRRRKHHGVRDTRRDRPGKAIEINELQKVEPEIQDGMDSAPNHQYLCAVPERTGYGDGGNATECRDGLGGLAVVPSSATQPRGREDSSGVDSRRRDQGSISRGDAPAAALSSAGRVQEIPLRPPALHRCDPDSGSGG